MAKMLLLLAVGLVACTVAAQSNCTLSPTVVLNPSYTFNDDEYIFVDGDFSNFETCGEIADLIWTVADQQDYGRYFYEPAATFGPGTYAGQLNVYLSTDYNSNATLAATYYFNVTVLNQTTPTDAPSSSGSNTCVSSPTVLLESNYLFGSEDYISIDGDFSYFNTCDQTATLLWIISQNNVNVYNTTGWTFFAYPETFTVGSFEGTLQVYIGDATTAASETTFNVTIVNGTAPTDAPASSSSSGNGCTPSPTVLLQSSYEFYNDTDVSIYGDFYYFQSCDAAVTLVWTVGDYNQTGYSFWEPVNTFATGTYQGSLNVFFGDNQTLAGSYYFTLSILNGSTPTDAPYTWAPWSPSPCAVDYEVFMSSNYWYDVSEEIVVSPDLDYFQTCGADSEFNWLVGGLNGTGSSFFEPAGTYALGDYSGTLTVFVNGSYITELSFNLTIYNSSDSTMTVREVKAAVSKKRVAAQMQVAMKKRGKKAMPVLRASGCTAEKLHVGLGLKYQVSATKTQVIKPDVRKLVGCGTHPALVWRMGSSTSTGRRMVVRAGAYAPGAYMGSLEVHSGRMVVKHTFLVVVQSAGAPNAAVSYKFHPSSKMQARLLGNSAVQPIQQAQTKNNATKTAGASHATLVIAGVVGVCLVSLVALGVVFAMRRRRSDVERHSLVQHA